MWKQIYLIVVGFKYELQLGLTLKCIPISRAEYITPGHIQCSRSVFATLLELGQKGIL